MVSQKINKALRILLEWTLFDKKHWKKFKMVLLIYNKLVLFQYLINSTYKISMFNDLIFFTLQEFTTLLFFVFFSSCCFPFSAKLNKQSYSLFSKYIQKLSNSNIFWLFLEVYWVIRFKIYSAAEYLNFPSLYTSTINLNWQFSELLRNTDKWELLFLLKPTYRLVSSPL